MLTTRERIVALLERHAPDTPRSVKRRLAQTAYYLEHRPATAGEEAYLWRAERAYGLTGQPRVRVYFGFQMLERGCKRGKKCHLQPFKGWGRDRKHRVFFQREGVASFETRDSKKRRKAAHIVNR